jgi:hypothetical protein
MNRLQQMLLLQTNHAEQTPVSVPPADPLTVSNLALWLSATDYTGSSVWTDRSPRQNNATQANSVNRPTVITRLNNKQAALFDGTNHFLTTNSIMPTGASARFTKIAFATISGIAGRANNLLSSDGTPGHAMRIFDSSGAGWLRVTAGSVNTMASGIPLSTNTPYVLVGTFNRPLNMLVAYVNGAYGNHTIDGNADNTDATVRIGEYANSNRFYGDVYELLVTSGVVTHTDHQTVCRYINETYGQLTTQLSNIVFKGGSWTQGYNVTGEGTVTGATYPAQVLTQLGLTPGSSIRAYNLGVFSQSTESMNTNPRDVFQTYHAMSKQNICLFWGGSNDIDSGASGQTAYDRAVTFAQRAKNVGFTVIGITLLPRASANSAYDTERLDYNARLLADTTNFNAIVDVTVHTFTDASIITNTTYYQTDQIHLTAAGYTIIAQHVAPVVATFL